MLPTRKPAFTLIELLVVIAVIAILAAILFPVFAQVRERARMSACVSNMRQIGTSLMLYVQDYDETYPCIRFHGFGGQKGMRTYCWRNAIRPYLKSWDVMACPSNPFSHPVPFQPDVSFPQTKPGSNAEGWEVEPEGRMPPSYGMNSCASTFLPADTKEGAANPPIRLAQLVRPTQTILIGETTWGVVDVELRNLWIDCPMVFSHSAGKVGNFIYYDGHVKSQKWLSTFYPFTENHWEPGEPNPDPKNRKVNGPLCSYPVPDGPGAMAFQRPACLAYQ